MYETFSHTADLGLRVRASNRNELFAEAGRGLFSIIVENLDAVQPVETIAIELSGDDLEYLLFDWLNELLYQFEPGRRLLSAFEVNVNDNGLSATARGESFDPNRHRITHEIKAITYHGLTVQQTDDGWLAEVIVDI